MCLRRDGSRGFSLINQFLIIIHAIFNPWEECSITYQINIASKYILQIHLHSYMFKQRHIGLRVKLDYNINITILLLLSTRKRSKKPCLDYRFNRQIIYYFIY